MVLELEPTEPEVLPELLDWLHREPELRGVAMVTVAGPASPTELGGSAAIQFLHDNPELVTAVATTVGVWLGTRARRTRIKVSDGDRQVTIDTGRLKDPEAIAARIARELRDR
jgi:hypothetical protein